MQPEEVAGLASASGATVIIVGTWHTRTAWRHSRKRSVSEEGTQLRAVGFAASCEEHHLAPCCPVSNTRANGCGGNASGGYGSQAVPLALRGAWRVSQATAQPMLCRRIPCALAYHASYTDRKCHDSLCGLLGSTRSARPGASTSISTSGTITHPTRGFGFQSVLSRLCGCSCFGLGLVDFLLRLRCFGGDHVAIPTMRAELISFLKIPTAPRTGVRPTQPASQPASRTHARTHATDTDTGTGTGTDTDTDTASLRTTCSCESKHCRPCTGKPSPLYSTPGSTPLS